ncbi:Competence protein ComEA helix-hairpin-helix repeat protein [Rhodococcus sp. AW25M09]|uniref:helix-hairpin-helix domain-containing protein n=1 Tax=Rhodococcus sp. AW25M09 TaxID=1268303 RepID=UPI0002AC7947|nr:helix-hairpin-helix domain-containing protein [Rhodococcus sp. AW25M09]CCQ16009.1 Competence protein ComEA helix-hairpin-helix repeat protein [Rhodococcus sp. AW25M09]
MGGDDDRAHTVARLNAVRRQPDSARDRVEVEHPTPDAPAPDWLLPDSHRLGSPWSSALPQRWRSARVDPGRKGAVALAAAGIFVVLVAAGAVFRDSPTPAPVPPLAVVTADTTVSEVMPAPAAVPDVESELVVSVVGLVAQPGLVRLQPGSRVADAVAAVGGPAEGGDLLALNMAARVSDGDQIVVGVVPPEAGPPVSSTTSAQSLTTDSSGSSIDLPAGSASGGTVDLNAATVAELDALPGVGPVTATSIVSWRETNGRFLTVDQLAEVDGIGPGRLAKIRDLVHVG